MKDLSTINAQTNYLHDLLGPLWLLHELQFLHSNSFDSLPLDRCFVAYHRNHHACWQEMVGKMIDTIDLSFDWRAREQEYTPWKQISEHSAFLDQHWLAFVLGSPYLMQTPPAPIPKRSRQVITKDDVEQSLLVCIKVIVTNYYSAMQHFGTRSPDAALTSFLEGLKIGISDGRLVSTALDWWLNNRKSELSSKDDSKMIEFIQSIEIEKQNVIPI